MKYLIKGIQSWDFKDKKGNQVVGSKLFVEHVPAKNGTVGSSFEAIKITENIKQLLISAFGNEQACIDQVINDFTYDKYGRVNGFDLG